MQNTNSFQAITRDDIHTFVDDMDYVIPAGVAVQVRQISDVECEIEDVKTGATALVFNDDLPLYIRIAAHTI